MSFFEPSQLEEQQPHIVLYVCPIDLIASQLKVMVGLFLRIYRSLKMLTSILGSSEIAKDDRNLTVVRTLGCMIRDLLKSLG